MSLLTRIKYLSPEQLERCGNDFHGASRSELDDLVNESVKQRMYKQWIGPRGQWVGVDGLKAMLHQLNYDNSLNI
jgi:hypothetical protein